MPNDIVLDRKLKVFCKFKCQKERIIRHLIFKNLTFHFANNHLRFRNFSYLNFSEGLAMALFYFVTDFWFVFENY